MKVFKYEMRIRHYLSLSLLFICSYLHSQDLFRNSVPLHVTGTGSLFISNSFTNESSSIYQNDATVTIKGDITNKQTTTMTGTGTTNITGTSAQQLLGNQAFFTHNLVLNNTSAGNSNFVFNGTNNLIVNNSMTFTDGIVVTNTNNLTMNSGSTYSSASNTSHVNGFVNKIGNQAFTYPVGDGTTLRIASISAPTAASDAFIGKYLQTSANPLFNLTLKDAVLDVLSTCEYWTINRNVGTSNVNVTLSWLNSAPYNCLGTTSPTDYYIGGWNGTTWKSFANGGTTGTSASGTVVSNTTPTVFGPFILATRNIPLPILLGDFYGTNSKEGNLIKWTTYSESNIKEYSIERSCDGINWDLVEKLQPKYSTSNKYSVLDTKLCDDFSYYRLVEYSNDNKIVTHKTIVIYNDNSIESGIKIYPNPNYGTFIVSIYGDAFQYNLDILDVLGKNLTAYTLNNGINSIDCSFLAAGVYYTRIRIGKKMLIKSITVLR